MELTKYSTIDQACRNKNNQDFMWNKQSDFRIGQLVTDFFSVVYM